MKESACFNRLQLTILSLVQDILVSSGEGYLEGQFICIGKSSHFGANEE